MWPQGLLLIISTRDTIINRVIQQLLTHQGLKVKDYYWIISLIRHKRIFKCSCWLARTEILESTIIIISPDYYYLTWPSSYHLTTIISPDLHHITWLSLYHLTYNISSSLLHIISLLWQYTPLVNLNKELSTSLSWIYKLSVSSCILILTFCREQ